MGWSEGWWLQKNLLHARVAHRTQDANSKKDHNFPLFQRSIKRARKGGGPFRKTLFISRKKSTRRQGRPSPHELPWRPRRATRVGGLGTLPGRLDGASPPIPSLPTSRKREDSATLASSISWLPEWLRLPVWLQARPRSTWVDQERPGSTKIDEDRQARVAHRTQNASSEKKTP